MPGRGLKGSWTDMKAAVREFWPHVTEQDVADLRGERDELMLVLKARYAKSYGEIEREVAEFELREARQAYATRPSRGIRPD